ncbi:MAG: anthranilate synthase component I family protein, partial [Microbacterium sp.]
MSEPLIPVELAHWVDPASVFLLLHSHEENAFWLDAGPEAAHGWSWVGTGNPEVDPGDLRAVICATTTAGDHWPAGRFRGGWVGWAGFD